MSTSVKEPPSGDLHDQGDPPVDGVVSANLRVLRAGDGERTCLVMVKIGSAAAYLPVDEARQAAADVLDLPRQIQAAIAIADQVSQEPQDHELSFDERLTVAGEPAGDADDGVISGLPHASTSPRGGRVSLPRRLCRAVRLAR
jgi:hypothetical protein